jgi:hypothetical protein
MAGRWQRFKAWFAHPFGFGLWVATAIFAFLAWLGYTSWRDIRAWEASPTTTCQFRVAEIAPAGEGSFQVVVAYVYTVAGNTYFSQRLCSGRELSGDYPNSERRLARIAPGGAGSEGTCHYRADHPEESCLEISGDTVLLFLAPFMYVLYGLVRFGDIQLWLRERAHRRLAQVDDSPWSEQPALGRPWYRALLLPLFTIGMGSAFLVGCLGWPLWRCWQGSSRIPVTAEMVSSQVAERHDRYGVHHELKLAYHYSIAGEGHTGSDFDYSTISFRPVDEAARRAADLPPGTRVTAWVLPSDPGDAVLERSFRTDPFTPALAGLMLVGGAVMLLRWRAQRRAVAAWSRGAVGVRHPDGTARTPLPPAPRPLQPLLICLVVAGYCAATTWFYVPGCLALIQEGSGDVMMLFAAMAAVGVPVAGFFAWRWVRHLRRGYPRLALSGPALRGGSACVMHWQLAAHAGPWSLHLELEEEGAEMRLRGGPDGTMAEESTRRRCVYDLPLGRLEPGGSGELPVELPHDAQPSFLLAGWGLCWQVVARDAEGRDVRYPVVVEAPLEVMS